MTESLRFILIFIFILLFVDIMYVTLVMAD